MALTAMGDVLLCEAELAGVAHGADLVHPVAHGGGTHLDEPLIHLAVRGDVEHARGEKISARAGPFRSPSEPSPWARIHHCLVK